MVWALEQAGRLMHAAVLVFDSGDCSTGVALAGRDARPHGDGIWKTMRT
jgi:hypothetical protein